MTTMTTAQLNSNARFWDRIAQRYARKPVPDQSIYEAKLIKTEGYLKPTDQVLELGCGTGSTALKHAPSVASVHAIDIASKMIEIAAAKAEEANIANVSFEVESTSGVAERSARYDVVLAHSVLHLVDDVPQALREVRGLLKPGGLMIVSAQCIGDTAAWFGLIAPLARKLRLLPSINVHRAREFSSWLDDAGFELVEAWHPSPKAAHYFVARAGRRQSLA